LAVEKNGTITATPEPLGLIPIKAGTFTMGASPTEFAAGGEELPQRAITLRAFYLGSTELTREKFLPFLQSKDTNYVATNQRKIADYTIASWNETNTHPLINHLLVHCFTLLQLAY